MKVLVLSHLYPSTAHETAGFFVHQQVTALTRQGVDAEVAAPVPWSPFPVSLLYGKWRGYAGVPATDLREGIKVHYPRFPVLPKEILFSLSGRFMHLALRRPVQRIYGSFRFDLIHAHVALPGGMAGKLLADEYKIPLVITVHGKDLQHTIYRSGPCRRQVAAALKAASRVILVSNKLKQTAEELLGPGTGNLVVIPNGIDPRDIRHYPPKPAGRDKRVMLSVSNLVETKGIDLNLRALARLSARYPDLHYDVVGSGAGRKDLRRLASDLGIASRVRFLGRQPHHRVMEYMAACDIFSLPSWQEGFGIVYLEAMAHAKPVIGCRGQGIEDFVEHGRTGFLVEPRSVDDLAGAIDYLLSHPGAALEAARRGRDTVINKFTWSRNAAATIGVYREVLGGNGRSREVLHRCTRVQASRI